MQFIAIPISTVNFLMVQMFASRPYMEEQEAANQQPLAVKSAAQHSIVTLPTFVEKVIGIHVNK